MKNSITLHMEVTQISRSNAFLMKDISSCRKLSKSPKEHSSTSLTPQYDKSRKLSSGQELKKFFLLFLRLFEERSRYFNFWAVYVDWFPVCCHDLHVAKLRSHWIQKSSSKFSLSNLHWHHCVIANRYISHF